MANVTVAEGGGVVSDGVVSFLPECAGISYDSLSATDAQRFDLTNGDYLVSIIPSLVPGLLFGILSTLGFIFLSLWSCTQCCGRRRTRAQARASEQAKLIGSEKQQSSGPHGTTAQAPLWRRCLRPPFLLKALLLATALAAAGVSAWGMVISIQATDSTFSALWDIVDDIEARVVNATTGLQDLNTELALLNGNVTVLANQTEAMQRFTRTVIQQLVARGLWGDEWQNATLVEEAVVSKLGVMLELPQSLSGIQQGIEQGFTALEDNLHQTVDDIQDDWEMPTMAVEERWRFVPIAVVFGTTVACCLLCALLFWRLRWYKTATLVAAVLWLDVALLMLLGVGLLNGVYTVSADSCKYVEFMVKDLVGRKVDDPTSRQLIQNALDYYFGLTAIPDAMVVNNLMGVPTYQLHEFVTDPVVQLATNITQKLSPADVQSLSAAAGLPFDALYNSFLLLPTLSDTLWRLESQALKSSIDPLYHSTKEYLCCTLSNNMGDILAAWTATGALGFTLALLCTWRLARHALCLRKQQRRAMAAAAAAVRYPPEWQEYEEQLAGLHASGKAGQHGDGTGTGTLNGMPAAAASVGEAAGSAADTELQKLPAPNLSLNGSEAALGDSFVLRRLDDADDAPAAPLPPA